MKRILVRSVHDAFDYVMAHYYPAGLEELAEAKDSYAVISIQDTHTEGFGFVFTENRFCRGVLTLYFDDILRPVAGAALFSADQARQIIAFIDRLRQVDTLLIHCYGGRSRSRAVGAFAALMLGADNSAYLKNGDLNRQVYDTLVKTWQETRENREQAQA